MVDEPGPSSTLGRESIQVRGVIVPVIRAHFSFAAFARCTFLDLSRQHGRECGPHERASEAARQPCPVAVGRGRLRSRVREPSC